MAGARAEPRRVNPGRLQLMIPHAVVHVLCVEKTTTGTGEWMAYVKTRRRYRSFSDPDSSLFSGLSDSLGAASGIGGKGRRGWMRLCSGCFAGASLGVSTTSPPGFSVTSVAEGSGLRVTFFVRVPDLRSLFTALPQPEAYSCSRRMQRIAGETPIAPTVMPSPVGRGPRRLGHAEKEQRT
jgi:hypothetical protein